MTHSPSFEQSAPLLTDGGSSRTSQDSMEYLDPNTRSARRRRILLKLTALAHPAHLITRAKRLGYTFVPQPIRSLIWQDHGPKIKEFPTSYLNGLRGITAVKVFTFHYLMAFTNFTHSPWAMDEPHTRWVLFPVIRYFYSGFTSQIFFACAGYLASQRLFQLLDQEDAASQAKALTIVAASLFRRAFRLYLPVFIITFMFTMYIYFGFYETTRPYTAVPSAFFPGNWNETKPPRFDNITSQLGYWQNEMWQLTDVTNNKIYFPESDQHLWSIHAEMRASIALYVCLMAVACCKRWARLTGLLLLTAAFFFWDKWEIWVYILSAVVAQIDVILTEREQSKTKSTTPVPTSSVDPEKTTVHLHHTSPYAPTISRHHMLVNRIPHKLYRLAAFTFAGYLLSFPIDEHEFAPGYEWIKAMIPVWVDRREKIAPNFGAALLLFLLARSDPKLSLWRKITTHPIALYLGSLSFSIYLVHGPLLHVFGYMIPQHIWRAMNVNGNEASESVWLGAIFIGWAISCIVVLCAADVWKREVEDRCVRAVKALEVVCFKSKTS